MTIVVTAKVTDGLVLAADSAATFINPGSGLPIKIYNHANKIFNLRKGLPIGAMVYGSGGIGAASVETLSKDLRVKLTNSSDTDYWVDPINYTIEEVARKACKFLYEKHLATEPDESSSMGMGYRVCGYSSGASLAEVWEFMILGPNCAEPDIIQAGDQFGVRWAGENEALDRLLLGASSDMKAAFVARGNTQEEADAFYLETLALTRQTLIIPAMPIQDAIDVSRFLVETASRFARYGLRPETIGGPVEIAAITKHEGFKWIARKHYYDAQFNTENVHA